MKPYFVLAALALVLALGISQGFGEESNVDSADIGKIIRKLDEVLGNQAAIVKQLADLKQEMDIVKIRCSR